METVAITDYQMISPGLARVVVSFTGRQTKDNIRAQLLAKLKHLAAPVEDSFRIVRANVAVGFLRANKEVRVLSSKEELRANYRVMSSNIMMDNKDKTLWEMKSGKGGSFLARHGQEDLSELVNASLYRRTDVPNLRQISLTAAAKGEFASFVSKTGDMDHGFVTASSKDRSKVKVLSYTTRSELVVPVEAVAQFSQVQVPREFKLEAKKRGLAVTAAGDPDASQVAPAEYWRSLYSYDPTYMNETIDQINDEAAV